MLERVKLTSRIAKGRLVSAVRRHPFAIVLGLAVVVTVLPLWIVRYIPSVDVPQHIFLVQVLSHIRDPYLPYQEIFQEKPGLTYLAFYYPARVIAAVVGAETAIRIWLTLMLAGIPIAMSVLLRALGRSVWLALLACPLVFTDNFYWGFISFQSAITWTLLSIALFVMTLEEPRDSPRYRRLLVLSGLSLLLVQATHGAAMILPALALPLMLLTTRSDRPRRVRAVLALVPAVLMTCAWVLSGVGANREAGALGEPWKVHGPPLQSHNFVFRDLGSKPVWFLDLLSTGFLGKAGRLNLYALAAVALIVVVVALLSPARSSQTWVARARPILLMLLGICCFLFLPAEIVGYMNPIDSRYAQVAALLAIVALPSASGWMRHVATVAAAAVVLHTGIRLTSSFRAFDREASSFNVIVREIPPRARIMHLVVDVGSRIATHPVYVHYAALAAARVEGVPSFSLAIDPSYPIGYKPHKKPPAPPSEWQPTDFEWQKQAAYYDYFLVRGPYYYEQMFRGRRGQVQKVRAIGSWVLVRRLAP